MASNDRQYHNNSGQDIGGYLFSAGQDMLDAVNRAVQEGNYSGLAESLSDQINKAIYGGEKGLSGKISRKPWGYSNTYHSNSNPHANSSSYTAPDGFTYGQTPKGTFSYFTVRPVSYNFGSRRRIAGILGEVFFGFFSFCFGLSLIGFILGNRIAESLVSICFLVFNLYIFSRFHRLREEGKRYDNLVDSYFRYGNVLGSREYFRIQDLAQKVNENPQETLQNLIDMKKYNMLPQASFDIHYTTMLLTDHARMLYQNAMQAEAKRKETSGETAFSDNTAGMGQTAKPQSDVEKILFDGDQYLKKIRTVNDEIPDTEAMSDKLYRLENITRSIFASIKKDPGKAKDLRRIMNYYLPTTEKLLDAYLDFYRSPAESDQKKQSMAEIEQAIDTVCDGFERFLAKLTEQDMIDISSDISVMKHMMEQDGMMDSEMKTES